MMYTNTNFINMKNIIKIITIFTAVLAFASCKPEEKVLTEQYSIEYTVSRHDIPNVTTTVYIKTKDDVDELINLLCDYSVQGKFVTFRSSKQCKSTSKAPNTFSTTSREEIKRWMISMEDQGKTVTVTYDPATGTWTGMAYAVPPSNIGREGRLLRATVDYVLVPDRYEIHAVYTYIWNGDLLTDVDMVTETHSHYSLNGNDTDSCFYKHTTVALTYNDSLRTAAYFYDANGAETSSIQYSYTNGRLTQEIREGNTYDYHYNTQGHLESWTITPGYNTALPVGVRCEWENGDVVRVYNSLNQLYESFEYDNNPYPYAVTLGTMTLIPEYDHFMMPEALFSSHNMTHAVTNSKLGGAAFLPHKSQGSELSINYTYSNGLPATAEVMSWYGSGTIRWTFEYCE